MSNYNHKLEGLELMYHLMKNNNMTYIQAKNEMIRHNQDMEFIKELNIETKESKWKIMIITYMYLNIPII